MNQVITSPTDAAKIATVVIQPRTLSQKVFTRLPMILRLFVINMISKDATGLSRGDSRLPLHRRFKVTKLDATALGRGGSRSQLNSTKREELHGASPWHLETLVLNSV
jgi:hypothetical protein